MLLLPWFGEIKIYIKYHGRNAMLKVPYNRDFHRCYFTACRNLHMALYDHDDVDIIAIYKLRANNSTVELQWSINSDSDGEHRAGVVSRNIVRPWNESAVNSDYDASRVSDAGPSTPRRQDVTLWLPEPGTQCDVWAREPTIGLWNKKRKLWVLHCDTETL